MYLFIVLFILVWLWIRSGFWNRQPMTHIYNFPKTGILSTTPTLNKYVDIPNIRFYPVHELTNLQKTEIYEYVKEQQPSFHKQTHFFGYLKKAYLSVYREEGIIQGCITSRHVSFTFKETVDAYCTDFIFANTGAILKKLIQTHEYVKHSKCPLTIFSSSFRIRYLVPLTRYPIQWVRTTTFIKYTFPRKTRIVKALPETLLSVHECLQTPFQCQMIPSMYQLTRLIQSQNLSIYYIYNPYLLAVLFFKNTFELHNDLSIVDWIGTILLDKKNMNLVKNAISTLLHGIQATFKIVRIHQVSDTPSYDCFRQTEMVKYVFNYGIYRVPPSNCLFI
jgi:hypothetical protein